MARNAYSNASKAVSPNAPTAQTKPIPGRETEMVANSAGGYSFEVTPWTRLDRFLILGTTGGTYYASEKSLTEDNAKAIISLIKSDGVAVVNRIVEISFSGRAPKNDPALFALALCMTYGDADTKTAAQDSISKVARIGTHVLHLAEYVNNLRGWGRGIRRAFGNWYTNQSPKGLATNLVKYANRDGWTHRDILRLAHPKAQGDTAQLLGYAVGKNYAIETADVSAFIAAVEKIKTVTTANEAVELITTFNLPREVVPTPLLNEPKVWEALLPHMGLTAMIRNLATMTRHGLLTQTSAASKFVVGKITDEEGLKSARVHPIQVLAALMTYQAGYSARGSNTWKPVTKITDALDEAFYASFGFVTPTNKKILYALDVSGSMSMGDLAGVPGLTPRVASGALAMLAARTEQDSIFVGFSTGMTHLDITPKHRLDTVLKNISGLPFDGTDCALPMLYATKQAYDVDAFVVLTDSETWAGRIHPTQALNEYRKKFNPEAKLIVNGMTVNNFTIADPRDAGQMDVVGFDTATPNIMSDFIRG